MQEQLEYFYSDLEYIIMKICEMSLIIMALK